MHTVSWCQGFHLLPSFLLNESTWRLFLSTYVTVMKGAKDDWHSVVADVDYGSKKS
jgi:hypothetical protein